MSLPFRASDIERTIPRPEHIEYVRHVRNFIGYGESFRVARPGDSSRVVQVVCFDRGGRL